VLENPIPSLTYELVNTNAEVPTEVMRFTGKASDFDKVGVRFFGTEGNLTRFGITEIELRICFSKEDTDSRPWRKINSVISVCLLASSHVL
jgi:hypothetical protein